MFLRIFDLNWDWKSEPGALYLSAFVLENRIVIVLKNSIFIAKLFLLSFNAVNETSAVYITGSNGCYYAQIFRIQMIPMNVELIKVLEECWERKKNIFWLY